MEIPSIKIEDEKVVKDILEVPIIINGENKVVKMVKISSGKRRNIIKRYVKTGIANQNMTSEVTDPMGVQIDILSEVIIEAPFKTDEKSVGDLPEDVVDYLYSAYSDWTKKKPSQD